MRGGKSDAAGSDEIVLSREEEEQLAKGSHTEEAIREAALFEAKLTKTQSIFYILNRVRQERDDYKHKWQKLIPLQGRVERLEERLKSISWMGFVGTCLAVVGGASVSSDLRLGWGLIAGGIFVGVVDLVRARRA